MSRIEFTNDAAASIALVIEDIRLHGDRTRPEVTRATGLSRTLANKYIDIALSQNLLEEGEMGISTGGRAPRLLQFNSAAGTILLAELGASGMSIATSDLSGKVTNNIEVDIQISVGPDQVLARIEKEFDSIISRQKIKNIWGIGIGLPGPVEFASGTPISPPIMPGWDRYPVRKRLSEKYGAPVWVDNDVNLMALGEQTKLRDKISSELIYIKIGSGIGAGILTRGRLHRGAQGCAGDIGHIEVSAATDVVCRCGNVGCLEAVAGGLALGREATNAAMHGESKFLSDRNNQYGEITAQDVIDGAKSGDRWSVDAISGVGRQVGNILATLVNFHNPSLIVIGGGVASAGDQLLASIRETVLRRSLPLATRDLEIRLGDAADRTGLMGAAEMVILELFEPTIFRQWLNKGIPDSTLFD